ncbi:Midasin [Camellia lanceoleosa]|uniref:Midasin n=1 Tax=Camellia lanceoleosa TaxID=1840588 RepID=A0ACC0I7I8_9ERIC|nr:Midasin [Camellia lanceoleosa]
MNYFYSNFWSPKQPGILKVFEADRLSSFFDSYGLEIRMINGLEGLLLSSLDAKLAPKHLFRLCLEHEQKLNSSYKLAHAYNFYKDSNAPVMVKMVELVTILQQRIVFLLNECDDHPALQKIVDVIEMILAIPLSTSLTKHIQRNVEQIGLRITSCVDEMLQYRRCLAAACFLNAALKDLEIGLEEE